MVYALMIDKHNERRYRAKTMRANRYAKASRALYRDLGMRRVIGSESGSVYYE